jgi:hypothetical protein
MFHNCLEDGQVCLVSVIPTFSFAVLTNQASLRLSSRPPVQALSHVTNTRCISVSGEEPCDPVLDHFKLVDFAFIVEQVYSSDCLTRDL